jgi:hypothetical protein
VDPTELRTAIRWLFSKDYLILLPPMNAWGNQVDVYKLNWEQIKKALNVDPPPELKPVSTEELVKIQWRKVLDSFEARREDE